MYFRQLLGAIFQDFVFIFLFLHLFLSIWKNKKNNGKIRFIVIGSWFPEMKDTFLTTFPFFLKRRKKAERKKKNSKRSISARFWVCKHQKAGQNTQHFTIIILFYYITFNQKQTTWKILETNLNWVFFIKFQDIVPLITLKVLPPLLLIHFSWDQRHF